MVNQEHQEFLQSLKPGSYVKSISSSYSAQYVIGKVKKVTKTQIVVEYAYHEKRFHLKSGRKIRGQSYYWSSIVNEPVTAQEIAGFERSVSEHKQHQQQVAALDAKKQVILVRVASLLGIESSKIRVETHNNDGWLTTNYTIKIEQFNEDEMMRLGLLQEQR